MARSAKSKERPSEAEARDYVKSLFPSPVVRKRKNVNGVWEVFLKRNAIEPIDYGFSIADAIVESALKLGWRAA